MSAIIKNVKTLLHCLCKRAIKTQRVINIVKAVVAKVNLGFQDIDGIMG
jgi:hypothetical protein